MVSCACTVGIFMGVSRRFVSVLRANMKAKPRQLEHRTSDEIRMLFVPSGVRTAHAGKGENGKVKTENGKLKGENGKLSTNLSTKHHPCKSV